ncbi:MAG TPA: hypothetical protein VMY34_01080 [Acidimicrobiales bacterium]|nr:hypothetical protein [Acidimicrobiales bacterium]
MRFALCDDDQLYTRMIELMLSDLGHEVVGVATATHEAVALIETGRPDVVIVDPSMGFNTDFDVIAATGAVGARTIVFSQNAYESILSRYEVAPTVVFKPDLTELEHVVRQLGIERGEALSIASERRQRPTQEARGRVPTSLSDAQAFYEALNEATAGDVLMSMELSDEDPAMRDTSTIATRVRQIIRDADRLLASPWSVRIYLPGADEMGAASLVDRLQEGRAIPDDAVVRWITLGVDESPTAAFDRLRAMGQGS